MSIVGNKRRRIQCATIDVGADAKIGDDLYVDDNCIISGNLTVGGTINGGTITPALTLPNGSASDPAISFQSSTNSGYFWDPSGTTPGQAWSAAGTKKLKLEPTKLGVICDIDNQGYTTTTGFIEAKEGKLKMDLKWEQ